jgi:hypothetical protein
MGVACILNSKRCGRTHCRYTGPYYLAMIVPLLALSFISSSIYEWITLAAIIVGGSKLIWWATEPGMGQILVGNGILLVRFEISPFGPFATSLDVRCGGETDEAQTGQNRCS